MATKKKAEGLVALMQQAQQQAGVPTPGVQAAAPTMFGGMGQGLPQNLMSIVAQVGAAHGNPNTEVGRVARGAGGTYQNLVQTQAKNQFLTNVSSIAQSQADPEMKANALVSLVAQHGTDYGLGVSDVLKMYQSQSSLRAKTAPKPVYSTDPVTGELKDTGQTVPGNAKVTKPSSVYGQAKPDDIQNTISGIEDGQLSPKITEYSFRDRTALASEARKRGMNLNKMTAEYESVRKFITSANSATQLRLRQAISSVQESIGNLRQLNSEFKRFNFTPANKAQLLAALTGADPAKRDLATKYITQLNVITDELGQAFMGGNSPTDRAMGLAQGILNKDYGMDQLNAALDELEKNLKYRMNAIDSAGPVVPGGRMSNDNYLPDAEPSGGEDMSKMTDEELRKIMAGGR